MTNEICLKWPKDVNEALRLATDRLNSTSDTPRLDAELLMAHALEVERGALLLDPRKYQTPDEFGSLVARRMSHEPLAYITGFRDFWTLRFAVGPGCLIPRPDSETLIEAMLAHVRDSNAAFHILDLGTGPGTLLLSALSEFPYARGLGVDSSDIALGYARQNAEDNGLSSRATFQRGNWAEGLNGPFDIILCNPPYIGADEALMDDVVKYEPASALFAGQDGLDDYRRILPQIAEYLSADGFAILEIGHRQRADVSLLAEQCGFHVQSKQDLGGRDRALILTVSAITN